MGPICPGIVAGNCPREEVEVERRGRDKAPGKRKRPLVLLASVYIENGEREWSQGLAID
jgi:hypothetical protein